MRKRTITVRIDLRRNSMRIMFQPDALHHQAPSNHTRHHHTLSGPPEKTSGFNIPNAPTASLHAQLTTTRPQLSVKLSLLPSRHDTASPPFPTQTPCPPFLSSPLPPTLHTFAALHPQPRATSGCRQPSHILLRDARSRGTTSTSRVPHSSLATSIPATSIPTTPAPTKTIHGHIHAQSHISPRPTRIQRFLHMPPTQPH